MLRRSSVKSLRQLFPQPVRHLTADECGSLRHWHAGVIETRSGQLDAITWRPWPRRITRMGVWCDRWRQPLGENRCCLYWHRPFLQPSVLALDYIRSGPRTTVATFHAAVALLNEVARCQSVVATVCHVTNERISERLLQRWGWERHCLSWSGRHYIRRFYDGYPPREAIRDYLPLLHSQETPASPPIFATSR